SVRSHFFEDLYEQCSFHIAEKMPSSVKVGSRPIRSRMRWYSSGLRPWDATRSGVMGTVLLIMLAAVAFLRAPLCPAGHLPHEGGDQLCRRSCPISPRVGEMSGRTEGGNVGRLLRKSLSVRP